MAVRVKCSSPKSSFIWCQILCERKWGLDKKRIRPNMKRLDFLNTPEKRSDFLKLPKKSVFSIFPHEMGPGFLPYYLPFTSLASSAPFPRLHICLKSIFTRGDAFVVAKPPDSCEMLVSLRMSHTNCRILPKMPLTGLISVPNTVAKMLKSYKKLYRFGWTSAKTTALRC